MNRVRAGVSRCAQMRAWRRPGAHSCAKALLFCARRIKSSGKSIRRKKERKNERTEMARKASLSLLEAVAMVTEPGCDAESDVDTFYTDEELDYLEGLDPIEDAESEDVVFDASAQYKDTSLNEHLLTGPDLTNTLVGVLCRFRKGSVAVMCDVERMFHQFHVRPQDQDYLRFLWWEYGDISTPPLGLPHEGSPFWCSLIT
ncbi:uncharacterized protein LOC129410839 [Boleophthalmus pectinirostris]|uniref:uncharacterized protein LOC129410839 n=1 Tax=Boleophthalmus pectinirostris TaxID=150288 RepID=UPI00242E6DCE|nr:uncharacterized protein LOC129410839 [Boleophthalmus pectinirostris]